MTSRFSPQYNALQSDLAVDQVPTDLQPKALKSTWQQFKVTWLMIAITVLWITFTCFFAYNSRLSNPFSKTLLLPKPSQTVTALNILSHVSVFLLQTLVSDVFEAVRWALAGTSRGVSSTGFVILSRATGTMGVLYLLLFGSGKGHHLWGFQR